MATPRQAGRQAGTGGKAASAPPTDFGLFYPMGYVIAAFPGAEPAERVRGDLLTGGYDESDVIRVPAQAMARTAGESVENAGFIASFGATKHVMETYRELAREGCDFLLIHAVTEPEVERVMNVVRRAPFRVAQKFHRFAIEDLE